MNHSQELEKLYDDGWHARLWKIKRVGWGVMALFLVGALAGLFGPGPASHSSAGSRSGPFWIEYNRFERFQAPATLTVHLNSACSRNGRVRIWISQKLLQQMDLQTIQPAPFLTEVGSERCTFVFLAPALRDSAIISFHFDPQQSGKQLGEVGVDGVGELHFTQFVYP